MPSGGERVGWNLMLTAAAAGGNSLRTAMFRRTDMLTTTENPQLSSRYFTE
jgi:hypothetical protein